MCFCFYMATFLVATVLLLLFLCWEILLWPCSTWKSLSGKWGLFNRTCCGRIRANGVKLKDDWFRLDIRKRCFTVIVVKYQHRCSESWWMPYPWKYSRSDWIWLRITWSSWRWPCLLQGPWTRWASNVLFNSNHSKILWFVVSPTWLHLSYRRAVFLPWAYCHTSRATSHMFPSEPSPSEFMSAEDTIVYAIFSFITKDFALLLSSSGLVSPPILDL